MKSWSCLSKLAVSGLQDDQWWRFKAYGVFCSIQFCDIKQQAWFLRNQNILHWHHWNQVSRFENIFKAVTSSLRDIKMMSEIVVSMQFQYQLSQEQIIWHQWHTDNSQGAKVAIYFLQIFLSKHLIHTWGGLLDLFVLLSLACAGLSSLPAPWSLPAVPRPFISATRPRPGMMLQWRYCTLHSQLQHCTTVNVSREMLSLPGLGSYWGTGAQPAPAPASQHWAHTGPGHDSALARLVPTISHIHSIGVCVPHICTRRECVWDKCVIKRTLFTQSDTFCSCLIFVCLWWMNIKTDKTCFSSVSIKIWGERKGL